MEGKIYRPQFATARDARVVRTRESLRAALLELLQQGVFEQISIREIATAAGIGYTTFFRHYPDKESLLEEVAAAEMRELLEYLLSTFDTSDTRDTPAACLALCNYVADHRTTWATLLTGGAAATLGTIGGSGPTAAAQAQWLQIEIGGVTHWLPAWT